MNTGLKILLAVVVVIGCVGFGALAGCFAGLAIGSSGPHSGSEDKVVTGALVGLALGAIVGLIGGGFLAAKVLNPPPPRQ